MIIAIITYPFDNFLLTVGSTKAILWNFIARKPVGTDPSAFAVSSALIPVVTTNVSAINQATSSSITYTTAGQSSYSTVANQSIASNQPISSTSGSTLGSSSSTSNLAIFKRYSFKSRNKIDNHRDLIVCLEVSKCGNYLITGKKENQNIF